MVPEVHRDDHPLAATIADVCEWVVRRARERGVTLLESALPVLERLAAEPSDAFSQRHRGSLRAARRAAQAHASRITPETVSATTP